MSFDQINPIFCHESGLRLCLTGVGWRRHLDQSAHLMLFSGLAKYLEKSVVRIKQHPSYIFGAVICSTGFLTALNSLIAVLA